MTSVLDTAQAAPVAVPAPGWRLNAMAVLAFLLILVPALGGPGIFNCAFPLEIAGRLVLFPIFMADMAPVLAWAGCIAWVLWWCVWFACLRPARSELAGCAPILLVLAAILSVAYPVLVNRRSPSPWDEGLVLLGWLAVWGVQFLRRSWRWWLAPGLSLALLVLLWANVPLRVAFWWYRPALEQLAEEARLAPGAAC